MGKGTGIEPIIFSVGVKRINQVCYPFFLLLSGLLPPYAGENFFQKNAIFSNVLNFELFLICGIYCPLMPPLGA